MLSTAIQTLCWQFENQELADPDLIDKLALSLCDTCGIAYPNFRLHLLLSELITNAIDHGVLNLQSQLKDSEAGFDDYINERAKRLGALDFGWLSVNAEWLSSGLLRISVQDSGSGFDYHSICQSVGDNSTCNDKLHGRGLVIISSLCESMVHVGRGNCIVVDFDVADSHLN